MINQSTSVSNSQLAAALAKLREEWEEAADGKSLIDMNTSVGLFLVDLVTAVDLPLEYQILVLGPDLIEDWAWLREGSRAMSETA